MYRWPDNQILCPPPTGWHWRADAGAQFPLLSVFNGYVGPIEVVLNVQRAGSNCGNVNFRARLDTTILASGSSSFANAPPPPYSHQVTLWAVDPLPNNTISAIGSTVTFEFQHDGGDWIYLGSAAPSAWWVMANVIQPLVPIDTSPVPNHRYDFALTKVYRYARGQSATYQIAHQLSLGIERAMYYDPQMGFPAHPLQSYQTYDQGQAVCSGNARLLQHLLAVAGIASSVPWTWGGSSATTLDFYHSGGSFRIHKDAKEGAPADPAFSYHAVTVCAGYYFDPSYGTDAPASPAFMEVCQPYSLIQQPDGTFGYLCDPPQPQFTPAQQWGDQSSYGVAYFNHRLVECDGGAP